MSLLRAASIVPRTAAFTLNRAGLSASHARGLHVENVVGHNTPFNYTNKRAFTVSYFALIATLFATPFVAVKYQLIKSGH